MALHSPSRVLLVMTLHLPLRVLLVMALHLPSRVLLVMWATLTTTSFTRDVGYNFLIVRPHGQEVPGGGACYLRGC